MNKKRFLLVIFSLLMNIGIYSCQSPTESTSSTTRPNNPTNPPMTSGWNIPEGEIVSGGVPKDGIPSLFDPVKILAEQADYLSDEDLVVGIVVGDKAIAYPHTILDWHEVVNEKIQGKTLTVSYCPLTGTAVVFDGEILGRQLKFGVSGLLFNNNLIMFDRDTDSHWPQLRLQCDEGALRDTKQIPYPSIETSWGTWKKLYPDTEILSASTGFNRPYQRPGTAYPDYDLPNSPPLFQMKDLDKRLPFKQRVHGVLAGSGPDNFKSKVYSIDSNQEQRLIHDSVGSKEILVIDVGQENFVTSYVRIVNGAALTFKLAETATFPFTFKDNETGSTWNVLGEAIAGPLAGAKLDKPTSFNAFWFAWGAFYKGAEIYSNE
ncbi:MAG: DUF3179 domain-containing protein [bacterium]